MKCCASMLWKLVLAAGFCALFVQPALGEIVSTDAIISQEQIQIDRERVRDFMSREGVEQSLKALGVDPEMAKKRVGALTDDEIRSIAGKLDLLPAGGALSQTDWILILLLFIVLLIAL
jgi:hypothetical protein